MRKGIVIKAYGGFYYVKSEDGLYQCFLRGRFRLKALQVLVGDEVEYMLTGEKNGVIENVLPRRALMARPPVANVDKVIIVFSTCEPAPNFLLLDRILINSQAAHLNSFICFNKVDLGDENVAGLIPVYRHAGYPVLLTSVKNGTGLDHLREILRSGMNVFAGPSGVGKSSILNALEPGLSLKMSEVSHKIGRGRHTTRHVELLSLTGGGLVVDTPGFSNITLPDLKREELSNHFKEFSQVAAGCQFTGCLHDKEPGCAVKMAAEKGKISFSRYGNYLKFLNELEEREKERYG